MDHKSGPGPKPKTVCERLSGAIRATTPFRTSRSNYNVAVVSVSTPNMSPLVPPPQGEFCLRMSKKSALPSNHEKGQQQSVSVPIIFEATHSSSDSFPLNVASVQPYRQGSCGAKSMNGVFSEYIDRAGKKIRSPTIAGNPKGRMKHDSFNSRVSDFIDKTKYRFHMPSSLGVSKIVYEEDMKFQLPKRK